MSNNLVNIKDKDMRLSGYTVRNSSIINNKEDPLKIYNLRDKLKNFKEDSLKKEFLKLCIYLVVGLRDRYSGNQEINFNKKLVLFSNNNKIGNISITTKGVLLWLNKINQGKEIFNKEDAETLIALCTHRNPAISRVDSYPTKLNKMFEYLGINYDKDKKISDLTKNIFLEENYLPYLKLSGGDLVNLNLKNFLLNKFDLDFNNFNFSKANLENCSLRNVNLENADFDEANLEKIILINANCKKSNFKNTNLKYSTLQLSNLQYTILYKVDLYMAILQKANFSGAILEDVNLSYANLRNVVLIDTILLNVLIVGTKFNNAIFNDNTKISLKFSNDLNNEFNHISNTNGTILTAIDSIE
jgi:uncharacterized protein YjbI with pentapeptide repeats